MFEDLVPDSQPFETSRSGATDATRVGGRTLSVARRQIGSLGLRDFAIIAGLHGHDMLPFPFAYTQPSPFAWAQQAHDYAAAVRPRFRDGDLSVFGPCLTALTNLDILLSCHLQSINIVAEGSRPETVRAPWAPSTRIVAFRTGEVGYLLAQRPDADIIDVLGLTAYDLAAALADSLPLSRPGNHHAIYVPQFDRPHRKRSTTRTEVTVRDTPRPQNPVTIRQAADISAFGVVSTHTRIPTRWMPAAARHRMTWFQIDADGDYSYPPQRRYARPMTHATAISAINRLIANSVTHLRNLRDN